MTLDLDFADIRSYPPAEYPGIIVFRLFQLNKHRILAAIQRVMPAFVQEELAGKLWIVEDASIRFRG